MIVKRFLDLFFSVFILFILSPVILFVALYIALVDKTNPFYIQERVGKNGKLFKLIKYRTMINNRDDDIFITIGMRDPRITKLGYFLRKYKIDELPQLINILLGHMSFVGPRPEIPKYVKQYTPYQKQILKVKPGLTSYASVKFSDENKMMEGQPDPEKYYIEKIMPEKINLDMKYVEHHNLLIDFGIIYKTFLKIFILRK